MSGNEFNDGRIEVVGEGEDGLTKGESSGVSRFLGEAGVSALSTIGWMLGWAGCVEVYWDRTERTGFLSFVTTKAENPLGRGLAAERTSPSESVYRLLHDATEAGGRGLGRLITFVLETECVGRGDWDRRDGLGWIHGNRLAHWVSCSLGGG